MLVQADVAIATRNDNTFISLEEGFTTDLSTMPSAPVTLMVAMFTPNSNPPILQGGIVFVQNRLLGLMFSEGVDINSVNVTGVSFSYTNQTTGLRQAYTLTGGFIVPGDTGNQVAILLTLDDFNVIRMANASSIMLTIDANTVSDTNGMQNLRQENVSLFDFVADDIPPGINTFTLDLNSGVMNISFTEAIRAGDGDINYSQLFLTNGAADDMLSLAGSTFLSEIFTIFIETVVQIELPLGTLNTITRNSNLCSSIDNCFILWRNNSFVDLSNISAIEFTIPVSVLVEDMTQPDLVSFSIDLMDGLLNLTFSEPVNGDTFLISALTLTDGANQQEAINGSIVEGGETFSSKVGITLSSASLNFAKSLGTPRLAIQGTASSDAAGNIVAEITVANSIQPTSIVGDQTPPMLLGFIPSDPSSREITLTFDEFVNTATWNGNQLFIVLQVSVGDVMYSGFTTGMLAPTMSNRISYTFSSTDFSSLFDSQYTEAYNTGAIVLRGGDGLIQDIAGNTLSATETFVYSMQPEDTTPPTLIGFNLDLNLGRLQLTFSEPVNVMNVSGQVQFVDRGDLGDITQVYDLNSTLSSGMGLVPMVELMLGRMDLNALKVNRQLCTTSANTFIIVRPGLAQDRNGNLVQQGTTGTQVTSYVADISPPSVQQLDIDMDTGTMVVQFTEPVLIDPMSLDFSQFRLGSSPTSSLQMGVGLGGTTIITATDSDTTLTIRFTLTVLNSIKIDCTICTGVGDCFLHYASSSFSDPAGNTALSMVSGILTYSPDVTGPEMQSFELDLNTGTISLTFSEPVDVPSFDLVGLTFLSQSAPSSSRHSPTEAPVPTAQSMNTILTIILPRLSLNHIKQLSANNATSIFLAVSPFAARDLALPANLITSILTTAPLMVSMLVADTTAPTLAQFIPASPNPDDITLIFDEFVDGASFNENTLTISLTTRQGTFEYSGFRNGTITSNLTTDRLVYAFSSSEFNATVSDQYAEAVSNGSVSLLVSNGLVQDIFGNMLPSLSTPLQFSTDSTRPTLLSFTLDLNLGLLGLTFSEPVNILSVSARARLQNTALSPTEVFSFTQNGTLNPASAASDLITVQLGADDLNAIKTNQNVGTSLSNTFLALEEIFAMDLSGNLLSPGANAVPASSITSDTSQPFLSSFTLDINQGRAVLQFSESIVTNTLDGSRLYLTGMPQNQPTGGYNLSDSTFSEPAFSTSIILVLSPELLNRVKSDVQVCSSRSNCFAFVITGAAMDVSGNPIVPSTTGTLASTVVADIVQPQLTAYTMDLDSGIIVLTFSEPVLVTGFNPSGITAQAAGRSQQLGDTSIVTAETFNTVLRLLAGSSLLNQLKFLDSDGTITLSLNSNTVTDTSGLLVIAIPPTTLFMPSNFVPDTTPPNLLQFIPSSGQLGITLVFDEFIRPSTISSNLLSFRLKNRNGQFHYTDLSSALLTMDISDRVTMTFPASETRFTDSSFLQSYSLSFSEGSICLNLALSFITDVSLNGYAGSLLAVYTNTTDTEQPELVSFTLNLNTSILNLTFSEDVNVLTVAGNVRFQSSANSSAFIYNLMNGVVTAQDSDSSIVTVAIDSTDLTSLMNLPSLATSVTNTYLFLSESFVVDFSGNLLNITQGATQASQVIQVIRGTMILGFDLDLDSDIMTLEFDRGVNVSTFTSSRITLTNVSSLTEVSRADVQLGRVELLSPPGSIVTIFRFLFSVNDTVNIKRSTLCYQRSNCFASFMSEVVQDTTGNSTFSVLLQVRNLFQDVTPPRLVAYTEFDLDGGTFTLIFSEPVNGSSASFTDVQFSDQITNPTVNLTLREGFTTPDHLEIDFSIVRRDLNAIKLIPELCTSRENCWVRLPSFFINDIGMNPFLHSSFQPDAQASFHQPLGFINDVTPPTLLSFNSDINSGIMTLFFSEVIIQTSFSPEDVTLLNAPSGSATLQLSRDTAFNRSATGDEISLAFTSSDLNDIKSQNQLFTSENTSYISLVSSLLVDTSANAFAALPVSSPQQVSTFVPDFTSPNMIVFNLYNNDNGSIIISFDEPVDAATLRFTGITLIAQPVGGSSSPSSFTLTGGSVSYLRPGDRLSLVVSMTSADLRAVKLITNLATGRENTYISITSDAVSDWNGNEVVGLPQTVPLQLNTDGFVSDSSRASLAEYSFDLNTATISLTFTDVLDISTLDLRQLTVQNSQSSPSETSTLIDSTTTSTNTDTFVVNLGTLDLAAIQSNLGLATTESNTYFSFTSSLVRDVSGLEVVAIPSSSAIGPATYIADSIRPSVVSFNLDMNTGILSISFSEPILVSTLTLQSVTMQNSVATPTASFTLTNSTYQAEELTASNVQVTFSYEDCNMIKSLPNLASSRIDTFINITQDFVSDTNSNPIQPTVLQVMAYIPDTVLPILLSFDFRLTTPGKIELHFSEAISYSVGVQRSIVLQDTPFNPSVFRLLSQMDTITTLPVLDTVQVIPNPTLLIDLINNPSIAASTNTLYMSIAEGSFSDFAGNRIRAIPSNGAMQVRFICKFYLHDCFISHWVISKSYATMRTTPALMVRSMFCCVHPARVTCTVWMRNQKSSFHDLVN